MLAKNNAWFRQKRGPMNIGGEDRVLAHAAIASRTVGVSVVGSKGDLDSDVR